MESNVQQESKKIGLLNGIAVIVGIMIGSGVFISPSDLYFSINSVGVSLIIWLLSGILSTIGAICYSELGTTITRSGGDYAYLYVCFGELVAFIRLWVALLIIRPTLQAIMALTFAKYVTKPLFDDNYEIPKYILFTVATSCLCILSFINCYSVRLAMKIQTIFTIGKLLALVFIVIAGFIYMFSGHYENFDHAFEGNFSISTVTQAFYLGLYAFGGWNYLNFVSEELKDPYKNLPRAIWIALPIVTLIYFFTNVAYFAVLNDFEMRDKPIALAFGDKLLHKSISWIISLFVALSIFGSINGMLYTSSVLFSIGSQEGHLPKFLSFYHATRNTPIPSILFTSLTSILMLFYSDIRNLIDYVMQMFWLSISASLIGLIWLRYRQPEMNRPIKNNICLPIISLIFAVFLVIYPITEIFYNPNYRNNITISLIIILIGLMVYYLLIKNKSHPQWIDELNRKITITLQRIFNLKNIEIEKTLSN